MRHRKKLTNYFVVKNENLTFNEMLVYAAISWKSDDCVSHITRERLSEITGIKKLDTISKITETLVERGLISKVYSYQLGKKIVTYTLSDDYDDYTVVFNQIWRNPIDVVAFCIELADLRYNGTDKIDLPKKEIAKRMDISRHTLDKYLKKAIEAEVVKESDGVLYLNQRYFPVWRTWSDETDDKMDVLLALPKGAKAKKVFLHYYEKGFDGLECSVDDFVEWCMRGCIPTKEEPVKEKMTFQF